MYRLILMAIATFAGIQAQAQTPRVTGVSNDRSTSRTLQVGSFGYVNGSGFGTAGNTTVTLGGIDARVVSVSNHRIRVEVPQDVPEGLATLVVTVDGRVSATVAVVVSATREEAASADPAAPAPLKYSPPHAVVVTGIPPAQPDGLVGGGTTLPAGIVYHCDPTIPTAACTTLQTTIAGLYSSAFTNANASIYVSLGSTGLGESAFALNEDNYSNFRSKLIAAESGANDTTAVTDSVPATNPFGSSFAIDFPGALARALGYSFPFGLDKNGNGCSPVGTATCFDGTIVVSNGVSLYYRTGSITGGQYDFFTVVEHETDEILGTASCAFNDGTAPCQSPSSVAYPTDFYRYHSNGTRAFLPPYSGADSPCSSNTGTTNACFSIDGVHMLQQYNNSNVDDDAGDWSNVCTNVLVQDAALCPGVSGTDISAAAEILVLDVVGYTTGSGSPPVAAVTGVTSTTANGTYGVGAHISIQIAFNQAVTVTGAPQLALNSGGTANYTSGTTTSTLTFTYVVAAGQSSALLDYTSIGALSLNGGTIKGTGGVAALLTLPAPGFAGSLEATSNIIINTSPTTIITFQTSPEGLQFTVDGGAAQTAPLPLALTQTTHTIAVNTTQAGVTGTQYVWSSWSDSGAASHNIVVGGSTATYTATFNTQYQLTTGVLPLAGGSVSPVSGTFYNAGTAVPVSATANAGYTFSGWTGPVANGGNPSTTVTMNAAETVTANFTPPGITIQTSPEGLQFSVDGGLPQTAPQTLQLSQTTHTIAVVTTQPGQAGTQYAFASWSDSGAASHQIVVTSSPATYTATFSTQYQLTDSAAPSAGGSVTPASNAFYAAGAVVPVTATANAGYAFNGWTGPVASPSSASTTVTMLAAESVTATFLQTTAITFQSTPPGLQFTVDGGLPLIAPQTVQLSQTSHTIAVNTTQAGPAGTQYVWVSWSDSGPASHNIAVGGSVASYTANFQTQYQLSDSASPAAGGSVSPVSGTFYNAGTVVPISATANPGYNFTGWTGPAANPSANSTSVTMSAPVTVTASFSSQTGITIQTNPSGLQFSVDGGLPQTAPQTLQLTQTTHTIAVNTTQAGLAGTQYVFTSWNDGGAFSHQITVTSSAATYTATFQTQYRLTDSATPAAGGSVTPLSGTFYNAGAVVPIAATANAGYTFSGWTGPVTNASSASTTVTMTGVATVVANFQAPTNITIQTSPPGLQFSVDGGLPQMAPQTLPLAQTTHTIAVNATQAGPVGTQYVFTSWSDTGAASHQITVTGVPVAYTATFQTQYQLTDSAAPAAGGSVTPPSGTFYNTGAVVPVNATANGGYTFSGWTGPAANPANASTSVTMSAPVTVTASFSTPTAITIQTSPPGLQFSVDGGLPQMAPQTLPLSQTTHTIAVNTTQAGPVGTQYAFASWSDSGAASHQITVTGVPVAYMATFQTQFLLTASASPTVGGSVTPPSGTFYNAGAVVPVTATANTGYNFNGWSGPVASASSASTTVTMSAPITVVANFSSLTGITIQTNPPGLQFSLDGGLPQTAPQTVQLSQATHTIAVNATQAGPTGRQYVFASWSDSGAASHNIVVGSSPATYTATFQTQFQLTISASPAAGGSVSPASGAYYNAGAVVAIAATANTGYTFNSWTGPVASGSSASTTVSMGAPETVTANFSSQTGITIQTSPPGLQFSVDGGSPQTAPQTLNLSQTTHTIAVNPTQTGAPGTKYLFTSWSDSGLASHNIVVGASAATYTATFQTQFLLTITGSPVAGGAVTPANGTFYNAGAVVPIAATTNPGFVFSGWTGPVVNPSSLSTTLTMSAPETVTANFSLQTAVTIQTTPPGLQFSMDGGSPQTAPQTLNLTQTTHTIAVNTTQPGAAGTQYGFASWSDSGAASHTFVVGNSPLTLTATFQTQFLLTITGSPAAGGSVTPASGTFYNSGATVPVGATPNAGYTFSGWTGPVASASSASTAVTMNAAETITANFSSQTGITIQTTPPGLQFSVDGGLPQTAPKTLQLSPATHTIAVNTTQAGAAGTQYVFTSWSDSGADSHNIVVGSSPATYTATFQTQFQLTISASPAAGGLVTPASGAYYNAGTAVAIAATASTGYTFNSWTGPVASGSSASTTVTMNAAETITANFSSQTGITIQTIPAGLQFSVDGGAPQTAPQTLNLSQTTHTIAVNASQAGGPGTQYLFAFWSDNGAPSHTITVTASAATYTATFNAQYLLTTAVTPASAGSVGASPASAGSYNAGTIVQLTATAGSGYQFNSWSGDLGGSTNPQFITMNAAHSVTANFSALGSSCSISLGPQSASVPPTGTSTVETCPNNSGQPNCGVTPENLKSFTVTPTAACGQWTATSSSPGTLQILSGASGTGVGAVGFVLLNNTHTGSQDYTVTVASGTASATYTITEAGSGDSQVYREVYALYEQFLGRDPDPAGFGFWTGSGGAGLGQMADSFLTSPEAFNSDFAVMATYQAATGAPPTYAQFAAAVPGIRAGTQTVTGLFNSLTGSGYAATSLYQNLLNRSPGAADSGCIATGLAACFETIAGFPASTSPVGGTNNEFQSTGTYHTTLAADHTNALYMQMVYYVTVSRDPDPAGFAFWLGIANGGGPGVLFQGNAGYSTRIQILGPGTPNQGFIGGPEFQNLFAN